MQPYFFPYIAYFSLIQSVEKFVIFDDVNFIQRGWVNRNNFLVNGDRCLLTLPVKKASRDAKILDVSLFEIERFKNRFFKTLILNYKKAPFYDEVCPVLEDIFSFEGDSLSSFLERSLNAMAGYLGINTEFTRSSDLDISESLKGEDRIISICNRLGAEMYINPISGFELYSSGSFQSEGIRLGFLRHLGTDYSQYSLDHVSGLSIVDVVMFNSTEDALRLVKGYEVVNG